MDEKHPTEPCLFQSEHIVMILEYIAEKRSRDLHNSLLRHEKIREHQTRRPFISSQSAINPLCMFAFTPR